MVQTKNNQAVTLTAMTPVVRVGTVNRVDWGMAPPPMKWREHNALCHRIRACDSAVIIKQTSHRADCLFCFIHVIGYVSARSEHLGHQRCRAGDWHRARLFQTFIREPGPIRRGRHVGTCVDRMPPNSGFEPIDQTGAQVLHGVAGTVGGQRQIGRKHCRSSRYAAARIRYEFFSTGVTPDPRSLVRRRLSA